MKNYGYSFNYNNPKLDKIIEERKQIDKNIENIQSDWSSIEVPSKQWLPNRANKIEHFKHNKKFKDTNYDKL